LTRRVQGQDASSESSSRFQQTKIDSRTVDQTGHGQTGEASSDDQNGTIR